MKKALLLCVAAAVLVTSLGCHPGSSSPPAASNKPADQKPDNKSGGQPDKDTR